MSLVKAHQAIRNVLATNDEILQFKKTEAETKWKSMKKLEQMKIKAESTRRQLDQINVII